MPTVRQRWNANPGPVHVPRPPVLAEARDRTIQTGCLHLPDWARGWQGSNDNDDDDDEDEDEEEEKPPPKAPAAKPVPAAKRPAAQVPKKPKAKAPEVLVEPPEPALKRQRKQVVRS